MSTPRLEDVMARRDVVLLLQEWEQAVGELRRKGMDVASRLSQVRRDSAHREDAVHEAAKIAAVMTMLAPLEDEARELAELWYRVFKAEKAERAAHQELYGSEAP